MSSPFNFGAEQYCTACGIYGTILLYYNKHSEIFVMALRWKLWAKWTNKRVILLTFRLVEICINTCDVYASGLQSKMRLKNAHRVNHSSATAAEVDMDADCVLQYWDQLSSRSRRAKFNQRNHGENYCLLHFANGAFLPFSN